MINKEIRYIDLTTNYSALGLAYKDFQDAYNSASIGPNKKFDLTFLVNQKNNITILETQCHNLQSQRNSLADQQSKLKQSIIQLVNDFT
jgi:hypothetical protein